MRRFVLLRNSAAAICLLLLSACAAMAEPVEFVVMGDMPYGKDQVGSVKFIGKNIRDAGFPFVIHYGDLRAGGLDMETCAPELMEDRKKLLFGLVEGGLFYTPGDNDWTDCDREAGGETDELDELDKLRKLFFTDGLPSESKWHVARQTPDYPENARWIQSKLQFVTLHIVGTDNGRDQIKEPSLKKRSKDDVLDAVDARDKANLEWLDAAFGSAKDGGRDGLVVVIHADPFEIEHSKHRDRACTRAERTKCNPYLPFLEKLTKEASRFGKPVLLVHGSTNSYCLDTGFGGWVAPNLWRLNGPGDFVALDAAVIRFDPDSREPFQVHGLLTSDAVAPCRMPGTTKK
jgi:hypothetical protein